jgi:hypothetical protein
MIKKFTIDRNIWLRGESDDSSELFRATDKRMCCVGIYLKECGVPLDHLLGRGVPLKEFTPEEALWLFPAVASSTGHLHPDQSKLAGNLYVENDVVACHLDDESDREKAIKRYFAEAGVEVDFVGGSYPMCQEEHEHGTWDDRRELHVEHRIFYSEEETP